MKMCPDCEGTGVVEQGTEDDMGGRGDVPDLRRPALSRREGVLSGRISRSGSGATVWSPPRLSGLLGMFPRAA
jgi:hypothetical protein